MIKEERLRNHLVCLLEALDRPCVCKATRHSFECFLGGKMLEANVQLIRWILENNGEYDRVEEEFAAASHRDHARRAGRKGKRRKGG